MSLTTRPAIFITDVAAARTRAPGLAGPDGRNVWSIMARPNIAAGEGGHGRCWPLVPLAAQVSDDRAAKNVARIAAQVNFDDQRSSLAREHDVPEIDVVGRIQRSVEQPALVRFRDHYFDGEAPHVDGQAVAPSRAFHLSLRPGDLFAQANAGRGLIEVKAGDTLICACGREKAAKGQCHRAWAGVLLAAHGWRVFLDGAELDLHRPPEHLRGLWPRPSAMERAA